MIKHINIDNVEEVFLPHRPGIDPENYRVGKVGENIYVWNPETNTIMDYYYDDKPELVWFDVSNYINVENGKIKSNIYFVNRDGVLKNEKTKKPLKLNTHELYQSYNITIDSTTRKAHTFRLQVHRILALIFLPNLNVDINKVVDHINRNKTDFSLKNLRWSSISDNNKNRKLKQWQGNFTYYAYNDSNFSNLAFSLTDEELANHSTFSKSGLSHAFGTKADGYKHFGYYWRRENNSVKEYLEKFNLTIADIDETKWKPCPSIPNIKVHPLGLIKNKNGELTVGHARGKSDDYHCIRCSSKICLVHRIVAETFLKLPLNIDADDLEVDHISTDREDNRVVNLRYCSHSENMNNPLTIEKFATKVEADGIIYASIKECSKFYKKSRATIRNWALDTNKPNFRLITKT